MEYKKLKKCVEKDLLELTNNFLINNTVFTGEKPYYVRNSPSNNEYSIKVPSKEHNNYVFRLKLRAEEHGTVRLTLKIEGNNDRLFDKNFTNVYITTIVYSNDEVSQLIVFERQIEAAVKVLTSRARLTS